MKRLFSIFLSLLIMLLSFGAAFASQSAYDDAFFRIKSLKLFVADDKGDFMLDKSATRAEFAIMLLRLMNTEELAAISSYSGKYSDVGPDMYYTGYVEAITTLGLMSGYPDGTFLPEKSVTYQEAVKTIVASLGYSVVAEQKGGYPDGYMAVAMQIGLLDDVAIKDKFTRADMAVLLNNALDIELLERSIGGSADYEKNGNTYGEIILNEGKNDQIYSHTGIVSATGYSYTDIPIADIEQDEVVIDNVVYKAGSFNVDEYLGMEVEFFAAREGNSFVLIGIKPTRRNDVVTIQADDIISINGGSIRFKDEKGKYVTKKYDIYGCMLKNGTPVTLSESYIENITNGYVNLIDNNNDSYADIIIVESYENAVVERVSETMITFKEGTTVKGKRFVYIDTEDDRVMFRLTNADGEEIEFSDIKEGDVVSAFVDENQTRYRLVVASQKVTDVIESISDDEIFTQTDAYYIDKSYDLNIELGIKYEISLDYTGKAVYAERLDDVNEYAYILGSENKGISKGCVKFLTGRTVSFTADVDDEDKDNVTSVPVLICENESLEVVNLAKNFKFNGQKCSGSELASKIEAIGRVVKIERNSDGEITKADPLDMVAGHNAIKLKYNVYDKTFGGSLFIDGFAIDENTRIICLPETVNTEDDYMVRTRVDVAGNMVGYLVQGYELDEETNKVKLVVVTAGMDSTLVRNPLITSSKVSMVEKVKMVYDSETGEYVPEITIYTAGEKETFKTADITYDNRILTTLKPGDLITYIENSYGEIENAMLVYSFDAPIESFDRTSGTGSFLEILGTVKDILFNRVDGENNQLATAVTIETPTALQKKYIPERNRPPVYIVERDSGLTVRPADIKEVIPDSDMMYVVSTTAGSVRACVIVR